MQSKMQAQGRTTAHFSALIEANNDATLAEFHYLLYQKTGVTISFGNNGKNDKTLEYDFQKKPSFV